jgi:hypothetical protein
MFKRRKKSSSAVRVRAARRLSNRARRSSKKAEARRTARGMKTAVPCPAGLKRLR